MLLTVEKPSLKGKTTPTAVGATEVNLEVPNDGQTIVRVLNGDASSITVDVASPASDAIGNSLAFQSTVPATDNLELGPFPPHLFDNQSGRVELTLSAITSVTVLAFSTHDGS